MLSAQWAQFMGEHLPIVGPDSYQERGQRPIQQLERSHQQEGRAVARHFTYYGHRPKENNPAPHNPCRHQPLSDIPCAVHAAELDLNYARKIYGQKPCDQTDQKGGSRCPVDTIEIGERQGCDGDLRNDGALELGLS